MPTTRLSSQRGLTHTLLILALSVSLLAIISVVPQLFGANLKAASSGNQCQDSATALASMDRSRNGISTVCNLDTLSMGTVQ